MQALGLSITISAFPLVYYGMLVVQYGLDSGSFALVAIGTITTTIFGFILLPGVSIASFVTEVVGLGSAQFALFFALPILFWAFVLRLAST